VTLQNFHMPASTWEEARSAPAWMIDPPPEWIERKGDGVNQRQYAVDTWGSEGSKEWKKEANAFNAVCAWFPEDRTACAKAKMGVIAIYLRQLKDYRRAVVEADRLISEFPDLEEETSAAFSSRGYAYLLLQDLNKARQSFEKVIHDLNQHEKPRQEAEEGIRWLEKIQLKIQVAERRRLPKRRPHFEIGV
jgi:tetratricopeptide (TPR) repeat protein